ncbi:MAG: complex I NDUFA9 subunit family protein [Phototrophicaceae bacterium]|jgi:NADH dehydrogenase
MKTVLVTGANGYVGNNIVPKLIAKGYTVRAHVRDMEKAEMRLGHYKSQIQLVTGDVRKRADMEKISDGADIVIHTVAVAIEKDGASYEDVNFQGTIHVVDAAEKAGVQRFINMSQNGASSALPYRFLKSKGKAQEYVASSKLQWTALRPSAIFGPQDEFFNSIARLVQLTPLIFPIIGGGTAQFQPVSVSDVAEAAVRSIEDDSTIGKELALGGPEVLTLLEIEKRILEALGTSRLMFPAPVGLLRFPVFIMENTLAGSPVTSSLLDLLAVPNTVPDNALVNVFGMEPIPFKGEHTRYLAENQLGATLTQFFTGKVPR